MKFLLLDDEPLALKDLKEALMTVCGQADEVFSFSSSLDALAKAEACEFDVAFLDIEMFGMDGITLARRMIDIQQDIRIIFVTGHEKYAVNAFQIHATGYLLKPILPNDIRRELTFIYKTAPSAKNQEICIRTFGSFSIFVNEVPVEFKRAKAKELLALLVDQEGSALTTREACAILWEEIPYTCSQKNYFHQILHDLRDTLRRSGADKILVKKRNSIAIDPGKFECDSYRFMKGDPVAINSYRHNYLSSYSWAEFTAGSLEFMNR